MFEARKVEDVPVTDARSSEVDPAGVPSAPETGEALAGDMEDFAAMLDESLATASQQQVREGTIVSGKVVKLGQDAVFVDIGGKSEGVIDISELLGEDGTLTVGVGDDVEATVVGSLGDGGAVRLSRSLARSTRDREMVLNAYRNGLPIKCKVSGRNKGGYEVRVAGMRGFVPMSQMDIVRTDDPDKYLNEEFEFRIMEVKDNGRDIVLSRTVLLREAQEEKAKHLRETLKVGDVLTGTVRTIRDYGAFVDIGGMDGLLHVSEMSWGRTTHPRDVVTEGQTVTVKVIKFDREADRLSLSMKELEGDPWDDVEAHFAEGGVHTGKVTRLQPFGAFVELKPGLEGLLHISNMVWDRRVQHPGEVVDIGQEVTVQILGIDTAKRRIALGMKQLAGDPWEGVGERYRPGNHIEGTVEKVMPFGVFVTVEPGVTALIPNSEMGTARGTDHSKQFQPGQPIEAVVLDVNPGEKRLTLSRKELLDSEGRAEFDRYRASRKQRRSATVESGSLGTFGSALGDVLAKARERTK